MPKLPPPSLTLEDIDRVMNRDDLRPPQVEWRTLDVGSYAFSRVRTSTPAMSAALLAGIALSVFMLLPFFNFLPRLFLLLFQGIDALHVVAETFYAGLNDFTLVSIPMFVMMGAAIGSSPAGKDLYEALDRWLYRVPGGLVISNLGACALFAALTWKRATWQGGIASIVGGALATVFFEFVLPAIAPGVMQGAQGGNAFFGADPWGIPSIYPSAIISIGALILVSLATPAPRPEELARLFPSEAKKAA